MLPVWQKAVQPYVDAGKVVAVGVVQEQHPDRTRLYAQWRRLDWPIFVDSLNLLDVTVVPIVIGLDESGIIRQTRLSPRNFVKKFVDAEFAKTAAPKGFNVADAPDLDRLRDRAESSGSAAAWRAVGDACFLPSAADSCDFVAAYEKAVEIDPADGRAQFRLGVALRWRYETRRHHSTDAQGAVEHWGRALAINPNQYIWRRRIQQYGPRLDKPYNFYFWVAQARKEIAARGEIPVELRFEPRGSELAPPVRRSRRDGAGGAPGSGFTQAKRCSTDTSKLQRDTGNLVGVETIVTPARVRPGQRVRVRVNFRVNEHTRPYWNNEADDLAMCLNPPGGVRIDEAALTFPNPNEPETQELRTLEFEVTAPVGAGSGVIEIPAYALYYVCENKGGKCRYLRRDLTLTVQVDPSAPAIK